MKKVLFTVLAIVSFSAVFAQLDRSKAPAPGKPRKTQMPKFQTFTMENGLKVVLLENHKIPRVSFSFQTQISPILQGDANGYISIAGEMLNKGTKTRTKEEIIDQLDLMSAGVSIGSSSFFASSLKKHTDNMLELLADMIINPSFPEEEFKKLIDQSKSAIMASENDPNAMAQRAFKAVVYGKNHPSGEVQQLSHLEKITLAKVKEHYFHYMRPNLGILAVSGDITKAELEALLKKHFAKWLKKTEPASQVDISTKQPSGIQIALVDKPGAVQSVIQIGYPINYTNDNTKDDLAIAALGSILGSGSTGRLYQNLRETHGYTYGAYAAFQKSHHPDNGLFFASAAVRNAVTDSAIMEFLFEFDKIHQKGVTEEELQAYKNDAIGKFALSMEKQQVLLSRIVNSVKYNLPKNYYATYTDRISKLTKAEVDQAAKTYIRPKDLHILVVGDADQIAEKLAKIGTVTRYDSYGNVDVPITTSIEGKDAAQILNKYFEALGGKEKLTQISSLQEVKATEIQGMTIEMKLAIKGEKFLFTQTMSGMELGKQVFDGEKGVVIAQGKKTDMDDDEQAGFRSQIGLFPQLKYEQAGTKAELKTVKRVQGKEAYMLEITTANGETSFEFYDVATGLLIEKSDKEGNSTALSDYKPVNGIMHPHKISQAIGGMNLEFVTKTIEFNAPIEDAVFKVE